MTHILVTNDDGVHAPGLFALVQAMRAFGESKSPRRLSIRAPAAKKTLFNDIPVTDTTLKDGTPALSVGGSPADCVAVVSMGLARHWPPDIVVSGINRGANMGQDITYSGTVTAALEAAIDGVRAVAVSLDNAQATEGRGLRRGRTGRSARGRGRADTSVPAPDDPQRQRPERQAGEGHPASASRRPYLQ
ncbi:MAG: hypothetical protein HND48_25510 [Chloroflexi bacterium]|nr:hypothetical protein [Chloroflexota bacterium]